LRLSLSAAPTKSAFTLSKAQKSSSSTLDRKTLLTEASSKHILLLRALADRQIVIQTELPVAVVTVAGTLRRALGAVIVDGGAGLEEGVVRRGGVGGLFGVERDNGAVGEAGTFTEGGCC